MQDFIALGDLSSMEMSFHLLALTFNSLREKSELEIIGMTSSHSSKAGVHTLTDKGPKL